jgi:hypothetical protein
MMPGVQAPAMALEDAAVLAKLFSHLRRRVGQHPLVVVVAGREHQAREADGGDGGRHGERGERVQPWLGGGAEAGEEEFRRDGGRAPMVRHTGGDVCGGVDVQCVYATGALEGV